MIQELTDSTFEEMVNTSSLPVLVDFWADWCAPCRQLVPIIEEIAAERSGQLEVVKVDVVSNPVTAERFGVSGLPTLAVFRDGKMVTSLTGVKPKRVLLEKLGL